MPYKKIAHYKKKKKKNYFVGGMAIIQICR